MHIIPFAALDAARYNTANTLEAYRKDGMQKGVTGLLLSREVTFLQTQFGRLGYANFGAAAIVTLVAVIRLVVPMIFMPILYWASPSVQESAQSAWKYIQTGIDYIFDRASPLFALASTASYIALIALGHVVVGALGLAMVGILLIKQSGYLPAVVDQILSPVAMVCSVYGAAIANVFIIIKVMQVILASLDVVDYVTKFAVVSRFLSYIGIPGMQPLRHVVVEGSGPVENYPGDEAFATLTFTLNPSHVHAKEVSEIISNEAREACKKFTFKEIYELIEKRYEELTHSKLTEQSGWPKMRRSMINGSSPDESSMHFETTRVVIKAMLHRIHTENDSAEFIRLSNELSEIGNHCAEGWTKDASFLLNPKSKNLKWAVHNLLSNHRGAIVQESLHFLGSLFSGVPKESQIGREIHQHIGRFKGMGLTPKLAKQIIDSIGGVNNIHLLNQLEAALWSRWRTFRGEVYKQTHGSGLIGKLLQANVSLEDDLSRFFDDLADKQCSWTALRETLLSSYEIVLPIPTPPVLLMVAVHLSLRHSYSVQGIIDRIKAAMEPQISAIIDRDEEGNIIGEAVGEWTNELPWEPISTWLCDLNKRIEETDSTVLTIFDEDGEYNKIFVERDPVSNAYVLTEGGIKLLLWDMGILKNI